jgi:hypothetical protein
VITDYHEDGLDLLIWPSEIYFLKYLILSLPLHHNFASYISDQLKQELENVKQERDQYRLE